MINLGGDGSRTLKKIVSVVNEEAYIGQGIIMPMQTSLENESYNVFWGWLASFCYVQ